MHVQLPPFGRPCYVAILLGILLGALALATPSSANPKYAGLVVDVIAGKPLYEEQADAPRYPASLTKVMTLYIVFDELAAGRLSLDTRLTMSKYASGRPPSKIGIPPGGTIKVRDAIKALVTKSANDVAAAIAENVSGSEPAFARRMTETARGLGMNRTTFRNASGLPHGEQRTTARDMAKLGIAIQRDFPQYYGVFQTRTFTFANRHFGNHNRLLGSVKGVDGIKTGYIHASGFNLVTSVRRDGRHIVAVVMGGRTGASRNSHMTELVERHLPRASRGTPMAFAAWSDADRPPIPGRRPTLATRFASRLDTRGGGDPIASVMAFAAETRAAVGADALDVTPSVAAGALRAVIALAEPSDVRPAPSALPNAYDVGRREAADAGRTAPVRTADPMGDEPIEAAALERAAWEASAAAGGGSRFADAFEAFGSSDEHDPLVAAIERATVPRSGITIIAMGSAPRVLGEHEVASLAPLEPLLRRAVAGRLRESVRTPRGHAAKRERSVTADRTAATATRADATASPTEAPSVAAATPATVRATAQVPDGPWQIQIGAVPSEAAARRLLAAAARAEPAMGKRARVTLPVATARGTLYRARFAGFRTRAEAQSACKRFANHDRPCWAVSM
ncbi:serine hydrolase [Acuticoccus sp.]|uniref:serine hydrolase n=1 Tax=Acuticoccus sp. TaxID=1904378 RepID=UPI003B527B02